MTKQELIEEIAKEAEISTNTAKKMVSAFTQAVTKALKEGEDVTLIGFGTFKVNERAARKGKNPRTGEEIDIPASKVPAFKAGKALRDAVN